jgi:hypothetical protein
MHISGISDPSKHYFVDDSVLNTKGAKAVGWNVWLFDEDAAAALEPGQVNGTIQSLESKSRHKTARKKRQADPRTIQNFAKHGNLFCWKVKREVHMYM